MTSKNEWTGATIVLALIGQGAAIVWAVSGMVKDIEANTIDVRARMEAVLAEGTDPVEGLRQSAPVLLEMLLGEKAIALNRAAASDPTGQLGQALAAGGREQVFPLLQQLFGAAIREGQLQPPKAGEIGTLFMHLLVGDMQVRRVIGTMPEPSAQTVARQAACAMDQLEALCTR